MKRFLKNVAASLRRPRTKRSSPPTVRQGRPQVECLQERLLPSSAPILTGDTFYFRPGGQYRDVGQPVILAEDATPGLSTRAFAGQFWDFQHGMSLFVSGTITATGAVTPGMYGGVPISTITFVGVDWFWPFYETVAFTGQVYGSGYNPYLPQLPGLPNTNSMDGTLAEYGWLGYGFSWSSYAVGCDTSIGIAEGDP
jgi:hypothetical protein